MSVGLLLCFNHLLVVMFILGGVFITIFEQQYHETEQDCIGRVFEGQHEAAVCLLALITTEPPKQFPHACQVDQQRRVCSVNIPVLQNMHSLV